MRVAIMILIMAMAVLLVLCYALMVMAHEADERAERMYERWKSERSDREAK